MQIKRFLFPAVLILGLAYLLGYSNLLAVKNISSNSAAKAPSIQEILREPKLNLSIGSQLARVNVRGAEKEISKVPWVLSAKVSRNWITGKVSIRVEPRKAIALVISSQSGMDSYIDKSGVIYRDPAPKGQLPTITIANIQDSSLAAQFVTELPSQLISEMTNLTLTNRKEFTMEVKYEGRTIEIQWGSGENFIKKWEIFQRLLSLPENKSINFVDLSDPKFPIVKG